MSNYTKEVSMVCITALILFALYMGEDGVTLAGGLAVLAGLGGYQWGKMRTTPEPLPEYSSLQDMNKASSP